MGDYNHMINIILSIISISNESSLIESSSLESSSLESSSKDSSIDIVFLIMIIK
jgi:hypothetical protein